MVYGHPGGLLLQHQIECLNQLLAFDRIKGRGLLIDFCLDLAIAVFVVVAHVSIRI